MTLSVHCCFILELNRIRSLRNKWRNNFRGKGQLNWLFSDTVVSSQITGKNIDSWPWQFWSPSSGLNGQKFECCKLFKKKEDIGSLPSLSSFLSTWNGWGKHKPPTHASEEDDSEQAPELQHVCLCGTSILSAHFHFRSSKTYKFQLTFFRY